MFVKRLKITLLTLLLAASSCISVSAHSGETDLQGGHWDRSTGEYHFHHGYPAHDHYDMDGDGKKDCPYDFKSKTNTSNSTYSSSITPTPIYSSAKQTSPTATTAPIPEPITVQEDDDFNLWLIITASVIINITLMLFIMGDRVDIKRLRKALEDEGQKYGRATDNYYRKTKELETENQNLMNQKAIMSEQFEKQIELKEKQFILSRGALISQYESQVAYLQCEKQLLAKENEELRKLNIAQTVNIRQLKERYSETSNSNEPPNSEEHIEVTESDLSSIPKDVRFSPGGLPIIGDSTYDKMYGKYTAFKSPRSQVYHASHGCAPLGAAQLHVFQAIRTARPCTKCVKDRPFYTVIPKWYLDLEKKGNYK